MWYFLIRIRYNLTIHFVQSMNSVWIQVSKKNFPILKQIALVNALVANNFFLIVLQSSSSSSFFSITGGTYGTDLRHKRKIKGTLKTTAASRTPLATNDLRFLVTCIFSKVVSSPFISWSGDLVLA